MKKYIFTESQIKKIIDSQLNEQMSPKTSSKVSGAIKTATTTQSNIDIIKRLKTQKVKLVVLGFRSDVSNSDVYNKNYKSPSVVGSIGGTPIDKNSKGKQFDNETVITLNNGATLVFGVVGAESHLAIANGGLTVKNDNGKLALDFAWD